MNIKQTFRIIFRNKVYSLLNIFGLAVGMVSATLIFLWVESNIAYNRSIPNSENLYVVTQNQYYGDEIRTFHVAQGPLYQTLENEFPEVKRIVRIGWPQNNHFTPENSTNAFAEQGKFMDPAIFEMIDMKFIKGDPKTAFEGKAFPIVISETMANKIFGEENPIGKVLNQKEYSYEVTGVFKDLDKNSVFHTEWILPFQILIDEAVKNNQLYKLENWRNNWMQAYVEVVPESDIKSVNERLYKLIPEKIPGERTNLYLYPINRLHLYGNFKDGMETGEGLIQTVRLFVLIGIIILFIACINFMNLSTARSQKRALEVGVRKTFGAKRKVLIRQFITESAIITLISLLLAVLLIYLLLPSFNRLISTNLSFDLTNPIIFCGVIAIGLLCTFMSGSYPAFYLSSFSPISNLRKQPGKKGGSASIIRHGLVIFQFISAFVLIFATLVVYLQLKHVQDRDFGIVQEDLVTVEISDEIVKNFLSVRNELINTGYVKNAGLSNAYIIQIGNNGGGYEWQGKNEGIDPLVSWVTVSPGLMETLGLQVVNGNVFEEADNGRSVVVINESFAEIMGEEGQAGRQVTRDKNAAQYEIKGVVKNFPFNNMYKTKPDPVIFTNNYTNSYCYLLFIRLNSGIDTKSAMDKITSVLGSFASGRIFKFDFMEERIQNSFLREKIQSRLSLLFAALAIFISCLGLFGLSAFSAEQRSKEIGIRKVLGATVKDILILLGRSYLILLLIAFVIGIPIAVYFAHTYLMGFEYNISIDAMLYIGVALFVLAIALITVCFQTLRAAMVNPVKSIKTE